MDPILKGAAGIIAFAMFAVAASSGRRVAPAPELYPTSPYMQAVLARIAADEARLGPTAPKTAVEEAGIQLRSVGFTLPTEGRAFPPGPGADVMAGHCVSCHTAGMILTQPALTRAEWTGEVTKMVKVYKAPIDDADIPAIVTYLAGLRIAP